MISVAMATYNGAKFIREQVDSILTQSVQDFELVICDDCSTDETFQILKNYEEREMRVKVYQNPVNLGFKKNFECVINHCHGDLIALSDQDDIWNCDHLEKLLAEIKGDVQIVCGHPIFVDEHNKELPRKYDYLKMDYVPSNNVDMARHILLGNSTFQGASMLIKKDFFKIALPMPEGANYHDSWFAALACFTGGLVYVNEPIMRYRRNSNSVTKETMRKTAFRTFVGAILLNHALLDRLVLVENILNRVPSLTNKQIELLFIIGKMLKRRDTLCGRIANIPYYIRHFKAIYSFEGTHLFT